MLTGTSWSLVGSNRTNLLIVIYNIWMIKNTTDSLVVWARDLSVCHSTNIWWYLKITNKSIGQRPYTFLKKIMRGSYITHIGIIDLAFINNILVISTEITSVLTDAPIAANQDYLFSNISSMLYSTFILLPAWSKKLYLRTSKQCSCFDIQMPNFVSLLQFYEEPKSQLHLFTNGTQTMWWFVWHELYPIYIYLYIYLYI